jgi:predicted metal-dependent enzyme (double-stranded beta helix superfamily)
MTATRASSVDGDAFDDWPAELRQELAAQADNPRVGTRLLLEDDHARVWEIRLAPGERLAFHRHVLDYFWTCVSGGEAVSRDGDGNTTSRSYGASETEALRFAAGESMIHDLVNAGSDDLVFTTVEFLRSANDPLPLAEAPGA